MYTKYRIIPFCPCHFVRTILSNTILSVYHFVRTILSNTILSVGLYHFVHTILSVPFCPLPFCPVTPSTFTTGLQSLIILQKRTIRVVTDATNGSRTNLLFSNRRVLNF